MFVFSLRLSHSALLPHGRRWHTAVPSISTVEVLETPFTGLSTDAFIGRMQTFNVPTTTWRNEEDTLAAVIRHFSAVSRTSETALLTKLSDTCVHLRNGT